MVAANASARRDADPGKDLPGKGLWEIRGAEGLAPPSGPMVLQLGAHHCVLEATVVAAQQADWHVKRVKQVATLMTLKRT